MMHSKKINAVVVICDSKSGNPFRDYIEKTEFSKREANVYLPFDTEYSILIKNNNDRRIALSIEIDGVVFPNRIVIEAYQSQRIERFIEIASKFKFVSINNEHVSDPTSKKNGVVKLTAVLEKIDAVNKINWYDVSTDDVFKIYQKSDYTGLKRNIELDSFTTNCVYTTDCFNNLDESGATISGSKSNQVFTETTWSGDDVSSEYTFIFNLKPIKKEFTKEELDELLLLEKLQTKYQHVDIKKLNKKENVKMKAEIISILDCSGSMYSIQKDTIGGYNQFIKEQNKLFGDNILTSLILFSDRYETIYSGLKIKDVPELTSSTYIPSGSTALLDTVCDIIDKTGERLAKLPENDRPEKVIISILTDGEENASKRFKAEDLKSKIEHQRSKYNWEFIFLGANQDSFKIAQTYGISRDFTANFCADSKGISDAYQTISCYVSNYVKD